jgi:hypothetical protein
MLMADAKDKLITAVAMILFALVLDVTSGGSPVALFQLLISFALALGGAVVGIRGLVEFLSERF